MLPEVGKAQELLCSLTAGSVPVTPAEGWHEQDGQHLLKYPFLYKVEVKNAALPQPDLPWPPQHPQLGSPAGISLSAGCQAGAVALPG